MQNKLDSERDEEEKKTKGLGKEGEKERDHHRRTAPWKIQIQSYRNKHFFNGRKAG